MAKKAPAAKSASKRTQPMSDEHKAALAEGREQGRAVKRYLEALAAQRPRRGRKRSPESISTRMTVIDERLPSAEPLERLHLEQDRADLQQGLDALAGPGEDLATIEGEFVAVAAAYDQRKGISYSTWRTVGVEPRVLREAGIGRGS